MRRLPALGVLVLAGAVGLSASATANARISILDDDAPSIARAVGLQPDGGAGLGVADGAFQISTKPAALPAAYRISRVRADDLVGRDATGMADVLRAGIRASGARRVVIDELGPGFRGEDGDDLAAALTVLSRERVSSASTEVRSRRVHVYVGDPGALLTDPAWAGARVALGRAGGVWLRTTPDSGPWTASQWLTWPAETARLLSRAGVSTLRAHVLMGAGDQDLAWRLARTGSTCAVLASGPGAQRLGTGITAFVARFRAVMPPTSTKRSPECLTTPVVDDATAAALEDAAEREVTGLTIPPLLTPPLVIGEPAQLAVRVGADPLGLAAAAGLTPEEVWDTGALQLVVQYPGAAVTVPVEGDGTARVEFIPGLPGPVTMSLTLSSDLADRLAGADTGVAAELIPALRRVGSTVLVTRAVETPGAWSITIPIAPTGGAPGDPVVQVITPPV